MPVRVHVNFAMSLDGCIGLPGPRPLRLSGPEDMRRVHELRAASDAVLVGIGTVLADDPKLTVKWDLLGRRGKSPLRVVLDAKLRTPPHAEVVNGDAPTLILHGKKGGALAGSAALATVPADRHGFLDLAAALRELESRGVKRLMVEGGSTVLSSFFAADLVDEVTVYVAPRLVGSPDAPRVYLGEERTLGRMTLKGTQPLGAGALVRWARD